MKLLIEILEESKWDNIDHKQITKTFRNDIKREHIIKKMIKGNFIYYFTDRYTDDDIFYGAVTTFDKKSGLYAGDLTIGKWNGDENSPYLEGSVQVHPNYRRQKVASTMYDMAEKVIGKKFNPAIRNTSAAQKFWKHRLKR